jgi:ABC-type multidrug transport system fused ATPase/permease subunit
MTTKTSRIQSVFNQKKDSGDKIMSLFITAGYPELESTVDLILGFEKNGADLIELGMPFSDPLADGPTIQRATFQALEGGTTVQGTLAILREFRRERSTPVVLFTYLNPVFRFDHVTKSYRRQLALDDVSFAAEPGQVIALLGENGAGKTTALKILLGLVEPDAGASSFSWTSAGYRPVRSCQRLQPA